MIQEQLLTQYRRHGIVVHTKSSQSKVEDTGSGWKRLHYEDLHGKTVDGFDCILWAIGRTPERSKLNLGMARRMQNSLLEWR